MKPAPPDIIPLSRFRSLGNRQAAQKRIDAIISAKDAEARLQALSVQELFTLISEIGFADAQELLELASPEQIRGCFDIDCWERDSLSAEATLPWISALIECGFEKVGEVWPTLDSEFAALLISQGTEIYDTTLGEDISDEDERPFFPTPDTFFKIILTQEREEEQRLTRQLIEDLYRADGHEARHVLQSARSEMNSYLEEMAYRWRSGRLADLGYVDFYQALEVFRPLSPDAVSLDEDTGHLFVGDEGENRAHLPVPILERVVGRPFLAKVLGGISNADTSDRLEAGLLFLVNRVLSAARVSPGDAEAMELGAVHASATLALGLEHLSGGDVDLATQYITQVSLTRIHRVGYTLTLRLSRTAKVLAPRSLSAKDPAPQVLASLLGPRPFYASALDSPQHAVSNSQADKAGAKEIQKPNTRSIEVRPFESRADLARTALFLQDLALRIAIVESLGINLSPQSYAPEGPGLDDYGKTALLRKLCSGELAARAISHGEFKALREEFLQVTDDDKTNAGRGFQALLQGRGVAEIDGLAVLLTRWTDELSSTLETLPEKVDFRFVDGLVIE